MANEPQVKIIKESEIKQALEAGKEIGRAERAGTVHRVGADGKPFLLLPNGSGGFNITDLEERSSSPTAIEDHLIFSDVPSFCSYVNEFKDRGTKIFGVAELTDVRFVAVLDHHLSGNAHPKSDEATRTDDSIIHTPRWGKHKATYNFPQTPEWIEILAKNKKAISQLEFAHMVERLRTNFKEPDGATMLELARTLEAKTEGTFRSSMTLENGDRELIFTQSTEASAGGSRGEKIQIPGELTLWIQPFVRGPHFQIAALFRYRVAGGTVTFEYELVKPHEFVDNAVVAIRNEIVDKTKIVPLFGKF